MRRKFFVVIFSLFLMSMFFLVSKGENQPEERVMSYLAVMELRCGTGIEKEVCAALTEVVINELVKIKKYTVIDRANRDMILAEVGFQQSGCVDESCTIQAGRILGVGKLVTGSITKVGGTYLVNLQLLNVETATVEIAVSEECKCDLDALIEVVKRASWKLMGVQPSAVPSTQPPGVSSTGKHLLAYTNCLAGDKNTFDCTDNELLIVDIENGKRVKTLRPGFVVNSLAFAPDMKTLFIGTLNGEILSLDVQTEELTNFATHGTRGYLTFVAISGDGKTLVTHAHKTLKIWDVKNASEIRTLKYSAYGMFRMLLTPDGKTLVAFVTRGPASQQVEVVDTTTGEIKNTLKSGMVYCVALSKNGEWVAYGGSSAVVELYNLKTGQKMSLQGHAKNITGVAFSPDNKMLASTGADSQVKIWDLATGKEVRSFDNSPFGYSLYFSFTDDGKWLLSASAEMKGAGNLTNGNIIVWDTTNWRKTRTIPYNKLRIGGAIAVYYNPNFALNTGY